MTQVLQVLRGNKTRNKTRNKSGLSLRGLIIIAIFYADWCRIV